jgi:hypothetical protein
VASTLTDYNDGYTAYSFDSTTGYLLANNVGAPTYLNSSWVSADASTDLVIKMSAKYINDLGLFEDFAATVAFDATHDMIIQAQFLIDAFRSLSMYVVNVALVESTTTPTAGSEDSSEDAAIQTAKEASIAAAVLASIVIVLLVALIFLVYSKKSAPGLLSSSSTKEINMTSSA